MSESKDGLLANMDKSNLNNSGPPPSYVASSISSMPPTAAATTATTTTTTRTPLPRPPPLSLPVLTDLRTKRVILASSSPRRRQILSHLGLTNLEIIPSIAPEDFPKTLSPFEYVLATATRKAQTVYTQEIINENENETKGEPGLIIAADTVVVDVSSGSILEKPRSEAQHVSMLRALRDARDHKVYTAVVVMAPLASAREPGYAMETAVEETVVRFDAEVTDELILAYVRTREGADKAGGYALQGLGSIMVERIDGSYDNVVGLPLKATLKLIERVMSKADDEDAYCIGEDEEDDEDEE